MDKSKKPEMTPEQVAARNEKIKHILLLIFLPSMLMIDKTMEDKSGHILTGIIAGAFIVFLISFIVTFRANFVCVVCWFAVNVWCWVNMWMDRDQ